MLIITSHEGGAYQNHNVELPNTCLLNDCYSDNK